MRTTKPIATISYNSPAFLALKLDELLRAGKLSFWAFIQHEPEDDEAGNKLHCHMYAEPARLIQTDDIRAALREFDPFHPDKPLGTITWRSSKFDDWYLYGLHDPKYLALKGQSRRFSYDHADFITSDPDDLLYKARSINLLALTPYEHMLSAQRDGLTWSEYVRRGSVPIQQISLFEKAWFTLLNQGTNRNGRPGHEPHELTPEVTETLKSCEIAWLEEILDDVSPFENDPK